MAHGARWCLREGQHKAPGCERRDSAGRRVHGGQRKAPRGERWQVAPDGESWRVTPSKELVNLSPSSCFWTLVSYV
eukprot:5985988-Pleurochrysis_carterae.AAC.1